MIEQNRQNPFKNTKNDPRTFAAAETILFRAFGIDASISEPEQLRWEKVCEALNTMGDEGKRVLESLNPYATSGILTIADAEKAIDLSQGRNTK